MDTRWKNLIRVTLAFLSGMGWVYVYDRRGTIIPPWPGWPMFGLAVGIPVLAVVITYLWRRRNGPIGNVR